MRKISVLIADADHLFRFVLNDYFNKSNEMNIVAVTKSVEDTLEKTLQFNPQVVLSDFSLLKDKNIIPIIKRFYPATLIGILIPDAIKEYKEKARLLGADFTVIKDEIVPSLIPTIKSKLSNLVEKSINKKQHSKNKDK